MHRYHTSSGPCALFLFPAPHKTPSRLFKRLRHTQGYDTDTGGHALALAPLYLPLAHVYMRVGMKTLMTALAWLHISISVCTLVCASLFIYTYTHIYIYIYIYIYSALPAPVNRFGVSLCCCCVPVLRALSRFLFSFCIHIYIYIYVYVYADIHIYTYVPSRVPSRSFKRLCIHIRT